MKVSLTIEVWRGLVANHLRRAWESQWSETTDREMDYVGERLVEDGWSISRATWAVREVVKVAYSPKGILAAIAKIDAGIRDRNGEVFGGWQQSKVLAAENAAARDEHDQAECYAKHRDFPDYDPPCRRQMGFCDKCPGVKVRKPWDATTPHEVKTGPRPEQTRTETFKPLAELLPPGGKR